MVGGRSRGQWDGWNECFCFLLVDAHTGSASHTLLDVLLDVLQ